MDSAEKGITHPAPADSRFADITDILTKSAGHAASAVKPEEPTTHVETASSSRGLAMIREKLARFFSRKKPG